MKNILVTGGCGFIGSNFIRYVIKETDFKGTIINVDKLTYAGNPLNLIDIQEEFKGRYIFIKEDICSKDKIEEIFDKYNIDSVCHFAAESHVDRSIAAPDTFIETNIKGTFNLLEVCRKKIDRIELFQHISTDEVYGSLGDTGYFTENTCYNPNSPYSASKASSDHLVKSYFATYGLPVIVSNCSNNYGPYQFPEKLIPLMILNAFNNKSLPVYGDGLNIRDWLYVRDHCSAIWLIMNKGRKGETYNIGGDTEIQNIKVVEQICNIIDEIKTPENSTKNLINFVKDRPGHDRRYAIDCTKLKTELGWKPEETFETGIKKTINWYVENKQWIDSVLTGEYRSWIEKQYKLWHPSY
ncbi:MAG: dTDP-glucose 4,6-dehydratase [Desulfobacterales bacterium]|nr:dTDP-glucose 4,6-dehydratase [Desulfobacterales bacterium]